MPIGDLGRGPQYGLLLQLDSIGFLRLGSSRTGTLLGPVPWTITFQKTAILVHGNKDQQISVMAGLLTRSGLETLKIVPPTEDLAVIKHIAEQMKLLGPTRVQIGEIVRSSDGIQGLPNVQDV